MNPLFDQFLLESREILEAADAALLRLERDHGDAEAVNEAFRAFHTLKGGTGLFDWPVFTRLLHAGEDVLAAVRDGRATAGGDLVDGLLAVLDQAARWVDHIEAHGALPGDAAAAARGLEAALTGRGGQAGADPQGLPPEFDWVVELTEAERRAAAAHRGALTAVVYDPDPECFFNGDDPLAFVRRVPGLILVRIDPAAPWPDLGSLDPYRCQVRFRLLSTAAESDIAPAFRAAPDQVRFAAVPADRVAGPAPPAALPADDAQTMAARLLRDQGHALALAADEVAPAARIAAAERAAANVLVALGRMDAVPALEAAADAAREGGRPEPLAEHLAALAADLAAPRPAAAAPGPARPARRAVRVEAERIDRLMGLVGELLVTKNRLPFLSRRAGDLALGRDLRAVEAEMEGLVAQLQDAVLRLRMLPLAELFRPLPRLVRDLAARLGKRVELRIDGETTEADKDVLDALGEPLLHLVRNAVDHGIETAERRRAAGKPDTGTVRVAARQDRDRVVIEVTDDGAGIDADAVLRKAVESGRIEPGRAAAMTRDETLMLVLLPGLSTAGAVTEVSGRGVGMDAVRSAVAGAGGRIEVDSALGTGTRVRLVLPLTMVITPLMVVAAGGSFFAVPTAMVGEVAKLPATAIRRVKQAESTVLRGALVPLFRLARLLGLPEAASTAELTVLVLRIDVEPVGLVVDAIHDRLDAVLKPLSGVLAGLRGYSGTTELGDGRLVPVIDPRELL
ncbi:chemotaxis protein CheA [Azospirillum sp. ST 5-10]|uniref:chemotaxis protein CheA n=1 Tax=unclassified Azospirillum TaxID=2630922 RepID=UPI003F4A1E77